MDAGRRPTPPRTCRRCYRHPDRETYIRCTRCERPICPECMHSAAVGFQCPECVSEGARSIRGPQTALGTEVRSGGGSELVTRILVGLQVAAYLLAAVIGEPMRVAMGLVGTGFDGGRAIGVAQGQLWRLVTASLLPQDLISLLFAVVLTYFIGRELEAEVGRARIALIWVCSAALGNAAALLTLPDFALDYGGPAATFGLLAASVVVGRRLRRQMSGLVVLGAIWLVLALVRRAPDWPGPVAGALAGALLGAVAAYSPRARRTVAFYAAAAGVLVAACALGLVAAR